MDVFDPADESLQLIDISAQLSSYYKCCGAAPALRAQSAESGGDFDPADESFQLIDASAQSSGDYVSKGAPPPIRVVCGLVFRLARSLAPWFVRAATNYTYGAAWFSGLPRC